MSTDLFERLDARFAAGTSKLLSRDEIMRKSVGFVPDEGAFIGRAVRLFGTPDADGGFVVRHRPTGIVITIYAAQSGPSYGGGPCLPDALPDHPTSPSVTATPPDEYSDLVLDSQRLSLRLAAAARKGQPLDALREELHRVAERRVALVAPARYWDAVQALDDEISSTSPADYSRIDTSGDELCRVGCRDGQPFSESLTPTEAVAYWLDQFSQSEGASCLDPGMRLFGQLTRDPPARWAEWQPALRKAWLAMLTCLEAEDARSSVFFESVATQLDAYAARLEVSESDQARLQSVHQRLRG